MQQTLTSITEIILTLERNGYRFAPRKGIKRRYFDYLSPGSVVGRDSDLLQDMIKREKDVHDYLVSRAKTALSECKTVLGEVSQCQGQLKRD